VSWSPIADELEPFFPHIYIYSRSIGSSSNTMYDNKPDLSVWHQKDAKSYIVSSRSIVVYWVRYTKYCYTLKSKYALLRDTGERMVELYDTETLLLFYDQERLLLVSICFFFFYCKNQLFFSWFFIIWSKWGLLFFWDCLFGG
jgi:hypothetical protein